jgi:lysophospholipase L1-like esterase
MGKRRQPFVELFILNAFSQHVRFSTGFQCWLSAPTLGTDFHWVFNTYFHSLSLSDISSKIMNTFFHQVTHALTRIAAAVIAALVLALQACNPTLSPTPGTGNLGNLVPAGTAINYVAIGNSLTAGFQSGAVVANETQYAYPTQLARQLGLSFGDGAGQYQYMQFPTDGGIGGRLRIMQFNSPTAPVTASATLGTAPTNVGLARPFNNLGIPGSLLRDMQPSATDPLYLARFGPNVAANPLYNPFFGAVLRSNALGRTVVDQAARLNPNLVTIWIGNNDVLGYASSGGASGTNFLTLAANPMAAPAPTETAVFTAQFNALMDSCVRRMPNAKFIVGNIPDVLAAPYFTAINQAVRASLRNAVPAQLQPVVAQLTGRPFAEFPNGLPIRSSAAPGGIRRVTDEDFILLSAQTSIAPAITMLLGQIAANPAMAQQTLLTSPAQATLNAVILDADEQAVARRATTEFNNAIGAAVNRYSTDNKAILFDANAIVNRIRTQGYPFQGQSTAPNGQVVGNVLTFAYISGGFFSLDGIHPSSRGYGAVTNEMIQLINEKFGADIPRLNLIDIPGLPVGQSTF